MHLRSCVILPRLLAAMLLEWGVVVVGVGPCTEILVRETISVRQPVMSLGFHV